MEKVLKTWYSKYVGQKETAGGRFLFLIAPLCQVGIPPFSHCPKANPDIAGLPIKQCSIFI